MFDLNLLKEKAKQFKIEGDIISLDHFEKGHINSTYILTTSKKRYIFQVMNIKVFPNFEGLMNNIHYVTSFLKSKGIETLNIIPTLDDKIYLTGENCIRVFEFNENTVSYSIVEDRDVFKNSGRAFGNFQNYLSEFNAEILIETIPFFHDTPKRFTAFLDAIDKDACDRVASCKEEIDFFLKRKDTLSKIVDGLADGTIPLRVTHNDTKLNNILFDKDTNKARAIIDLDTIMPGSMLYDFGDSIRFGASTALEDEQDLSKVNFSLDLFKAYAEGFCYAVKDTITQKEKELLPYGSYLMTAECGMRFLTDYLSGDTYFATKYPEHNLVRTRTQIKLATEMQDNFDKMDKIIEEIFN